VRDLKPNKDAKGGGGHGKAPRRLSKRPVITPPAPHGGPIPLCGLAIQNQKEPIKMSETQNPDPNKKDIPDLTPDKDAKGGVGGGPPMHRKEK
jgi:hypothetical protein